MAKKGTAAISRPPPRAVAKEVSVPGLTNAVFVKVPTDWWAKPNSAWTNGETGPGKASCGPNKYVFRRTLPPFNLPYCSPKSRLPLKNGKNLYAPENSQPGKLGCWVTNAGGGPGTSSTERTSPRT